MTEQEQPLLKTQLILPDIMGDGKSCCRHRWMLLLRARVGTTAVRDRGAVADGSRLQLLAPGRRRQEQRSLLLKARARA